MYKLKKTVKPNPANTWTAFDYKLTNKESVGYIKITDISGMEIKQFKITGNQVQKAWDIRRIKQGVYIYTLNAGGLTKSGKLIIK